MKLLTIGLLALLAIPFCKATSTSVSISGLCAPFMSMSSLQGNAVSVSDQQKTCLEEDGMDYATESVSANANGHSFWTNGAGITGDYSTYVDAKASYTETDLITGTEQGAGILYLLFDIGLTTEWGPSADVSVQISSSVGTDGFQIVCTSDWYENESCPAGSAQYGDTLEIPFTYGTPFTYSVYFDANGGAGGGSFIYSSGAALADMTTGNPLDTIVDPNPVPSPELPSWQCFGIGLLLLCIRSSIKT